MTPLVGVRTLERLARLDVAVRRAAGGGRVGDRESGVAGVGTIFREHRTYSPGDDLRYVDWNAYGRLRSLHVKVFELEENLDVHLLVDTTASMGAGKGSKLEAALRAAGIVGAVALGRGDVVRLSLLPGSAGAYSGADSVPRFLGALGGATPAARVPLSDAIRAAFPHVRRRGLALLVTDFLDEPAAWRRAVDYLRHLRVELVCLHVVASEERNPTATGHLRLIDSESGEEFDLAVDDDLLARYRQRFDKRLRDVGAWLRGRRVPHVVIDAARASDAELVRQLVRERVLR